MSLTISACARGEEAASGRTIRTVPCEPLADQHHIDQHNININITFSFGSTMAKRRHAGGDLICKRRQTEGSEGQDDEPVEGEKEEEEESFTLIMTKR